MLREGFFAVQGGGSASRDGRDPPRNYEYPRKLVIGNLMCV